ncbi:hypothetical protein BK133_22605 [Paenibacillus sp. FSL H8-0548]|uniref:hypothetical protein n=1 Tax=Paenibacillus sp. FSL H8-0548 TaxID=1920422 RepID=UPI00096F335E|nr:hypothetical protein [Paenibacillus sp. FSL H8-0548]OMF24517.1 hypothetical protein BK133_22605 [Paenibacillus sp. FSL H8-0548]
MKVRQVVWPKPVRSKLLSFRSEFFTTEETLDYIVQIILETEDLLLNPVFNKPYTEEFGEYAGLMRVVIRKFRFFVECIGEETIVVAVKCPGEN